MDDSLERIPPHSTSLILSEEEKGLAKILVDVNMLVPFKLEGQEIILWAKSIKELAPGLEPEKLTFLMKCFKSEVIPWDKTKGIQNVFLGLRRIRKTQAGYSVLPIIY